MIIECKIFLEKMQNEFAKNNDVLRCHLSLWLPEELEALDYEVIYDSTYHKRHNIMNIEGAIICYKTL
jgi:hypothetical protein